MQNTRHETQTSEERIGFFTKHRYPTFRCARSVSRSICSLARSLKYYLGDTSSSVQAQLPSVATPSPIVNKQHPSISPPTTTTPAYASDHTTKEQPNHGLLRRHNPPKPEPHNPHRLHPPPLPARPSNNPPRPIPRQSTLPQTRRRNRPPLRLLPHRMRTPQKPSRARDRQSRTAMWT